MTAMYEGVFAVARKYRTAVNESSDRMISELRMRMLNGPTGDDPRSNLQFVTDLKDEHKARVKAAGDIMVKEMNDARRAAALN